MSALLETLASYVPSLVVRRYAEHPDPIITPGAERFPSAIFFADITGFTALTERLARLGPVGAEEVSRLLNDYFGQLIELVDAHGGDVVKFAGDALLALWPAVDEPLEAAVRRAAQCGLAAQAALHDYAAARDVRLSLRVGIGAGEMTSAHIGGVDGRWEFLATGAPLSQIGAIKTEALPGDVIVSPEAWSLAGQWFTGHALPTGSMRLESARDSLLPRRALRPALKAEMELPLRAYIPGAILERLAAGQSEWLAELRRVTVIFVNLPRQDDNAPRGLKQAQMITRALQSVLYRYEASIDKISVDDTGANLVAALGLPPWTHEDDAARGAQVALAIQSLLRELGLRPAIGVAGGLAFCGSVGTAARREYTMVGDVVNLAARLMQSARDDILCDAATVQAAHAQIEFQPLPAIRVKGKAEPVAIYRPIRAARATARPHVTMIGRAAEWAMLSERMQNLLHGEPGGTVVIEGEAGIGKSRLVDEALRRAQELGLTCLLGAGDAIEKNTPYHAWRDICVKLLDLHAETDLETTREQILDRLRHDPQVASLAPLLNVALPVDLPENETTASMTDQARADAARDVLLRLLSDLPRSEGTPDDRRPKVIVLEDAHWLDSASWALALLVSRRVERSLLIVTARPMSDPPPPEYLQLMQSPNTRRLHLEALPAEDTHAIVCQRLGVRSLPEPVADLIREKAEGHPFFSEEVAYALRDAGLIRIAGGECRLAPDAGDLRVLAFPDTIQGVITSRIDRLTPPQQMTVKAASVIGRVFPFRILHDIYPIDSDRPHLAGYLDALQRSNLTLLDTPEPDLAYIFKHVITQDVAYNLMLFAQRRQLHRAAAEWYERAPARERGRARYDQLLAYHWSLAGDDEKAAGYLEKAAHQAMRSGANAEAKALFEQALETLSRLPVTPEGQRQVVDLAVDLARVGAYLPSDSILEALKRAQDAAASLGDEARLAQVYGGAGAFHYVMGRLNEALDSFGKCMALAEKLGLEGLLMQPYNVVGRAVAVSGDFARAADLLAKGIALAERYRDVELLAGSLAFYASTFWFQGERAEGTPHAERGLALAEELERPSRIAGNLMTMGFYHCFCGFFDEAAVHLKRCLSIAEPKQYVQPLYIAYGCLGYLHLQEGDLGRARRYLDDCLRLAETNKASAFVPMYQAYRAEIDLIDGDWPAALARAEAASAGAERSRQRMALGEAQRILGRVHARVATPDWEKAEQAIKTSIALQQKCNALPLVAAGTLDLGVLYRDRGLTDLARATIGEAIAMFERLEMAWHLDRARHIVASL